MKRSANTTRVASAVASLAFSVCAGISHAQVGGDFDGDGFDDLAIGVPFEDMDGQTDSGVVQILYGANGSLRGSRDQIWHLNSHGIKGESVSGDHFGAALAVGDFNGDGHADLAIGVPGGDVQGIPDAGRVHVIYGTGNGLRSNKNQRWHQNSDGIDEEAEAFDGFGAALAAGDFDGDGRDDLAIGVPFEDIDGNDVGTVHILYGSSNGLKASGSQRLEQGFNSGIEGEMQSGDMFGFALAAGDFDNDGRDDLAIGVPNDSVDGAGEAGAVNVLYGSNNGLTTNGNQRWTQNRSTMLDDAEPGDHFGFSLATGDFNGDGRDDLLVGIPGEDIGPIADAGAIAIIYARSQGLRVADNQFIHQDTPNVNNTAQFNDQFGYAVGAGDFDDDGFDDIIVGIPFEDVQGELDAGAVAVLYGRNSGIGIGGDKFFHQNTVGFRGSVKDQDQFGAAITVGDFNGDGRMDVAIAIPGEDIDSVPDSGAVQVLYGSSQNGLSGSGDQIWSQNSGGVADSAEANDVMGLSLGR